MSVIKDSYHVLELPEELTFPECTVISATSFLLLPKTLDYLRKVALTRGRVLFIESDGADSNVNLIRESILLSLTHIY